MMLQTPFNINQRITFKITPFNTLSLLIKKRITFKKKTLARKPQVFLRKTIEKLDSEPKQDRQIFSHVWHCRKLRALPHESRSQIFSPCGPKNLHNSNKIFTPSHFKLAQFLTSQWKQKKRRYSKTKIKNSVPFFSILRYANLCMHSCAAMEGNNS